MRAQAGCFVQEGDKPVTLAWLKDGKPLESDESVKVSQMDEFTSMLIIEPAEARHSANYTCVATNAARKTTSTAPLIISGE